ncbi:nucleoside phosphorylase [Pseudorhizobium tarimense]|uniref:Nucleoside phosphorylase n=1 Tax=Pseudorhizobium tarimense TaxID=1079109 RepID=A0ABV2H2F8_9HYPH
MFLSGVSMVNAAMTTQQAIDHFDITSVVFSGIAGGVDPSLSIGDVVVSDQWGKYLEAIFARETNGTFTVPPFLDTQFLNFGMIFPNETEVLRDGLSEPEDRFWLPVDAKLLATARGVATKVELSKCAGEGKCLSHQPKVVVGGNGV